MKGILKKWLFGDVALKTFYSIRTAENEIKEVVSLKTKDQEIDISHAHAVVCLEPMQIGFFLPNYDITDFADQLWLEVRVENVLRAKAQLSFTETIDIAGNRFHICAVLTATSFQLNNTKQNLLLNLFLKNQATSNILERKKMAVLYAYPRKVILVSVKDDQYINIFPMDLQCYIPDLGLQVLGLRTTNVALNKILQLKKLVVSDTQNIATDTVIELGKHHTTVPTAFPFQIIESELFKFPIAAPVGSYCEMEILFHKNIGSHTLMIGKTVNEKALQRPQADLYHLHAFEYLDSGYGI